MRRWRWMVICVLVASACGGSDSGGDAAAPAPSDAAALSPEATVATGASPEVVVESGDGVVTLSLQAGSLPEDVSPEDIHIEARLDDSDDPAIPIVAVQLLPTGLVLAEPGVLTVALPEAPDSGLIASLSSGDSIEFLDGQIDRVDGAFSFTTSVKHFSVFSLYGQDSFFEATLDVDRQSVSEGDIQTGRATIRPKEEDGHMFIHFQSDGPGTARLVRFSAQPPYTFHPGHFTHHPGWDPVEKWIDAAVTPNGATYSASFKCVGTNDRDLDFSGSINFTLRLEHLGPPGDRLTFDFGAPAGTRTGGELSSTVGSVGQTFDVFMNLYADTPSSCGVTDSGTATGSDTPPVTEGPERQLLSENLRDCSLGGVEDSGGGEYVVTFLGDCQAASEEYHDFGVTVEVTDEEWGTSSDSGIRELCTFRVLGGEVLVRCDVFDQATSVDGVVDGVRFSGEAGWTAGNEITFNAETALSGGDVSGLVSIKVAEGSERENERYP